MSHHDFRKLGWKPQKPEFTTRSTTMSRASRSWTCDFCRTPNRAQLKRCSGCHAWREGVKRDDVPPPACTDEEAATAMLQIAADDTQAAVPANQKLRTTLDLQYQKLN